MKRIRSRGISINSKTSLTSINPLLIEKGSLQELIPQKGPSNRSLLPILERKKSAGFLERNNQKMISLILRGEKRSQMEELRHEEENGLIYDDIDQILKIVNMSNLVIKHSKTGRGMHRELYQYVYDLNLKVLSKKKQELKNSILVVSTTNIVEDAVRGLIRQVYEEGAWKVQKVKMKA